MQGQPVVAALAEQQDKVLRQCDEDAGGGERLVALIPSRKLALQQRRS